VKCNNAYTMIHFLLAVMCRHRQCKCRWNHNR